MRADGLLRWASLAQPPRRPAHAHGARACRRVGLVSGQAFTLVMGAVISVEGADPPLLPDALIRVKAGSRRESKYHQASVFSYIGILLSLNH